MRSIIIFQFMIKDLKLSGINLLLYALIYGFSQHNSECLLSVKGYCNFLGCSRAQFYRAKSYLVGKNLIFHSLNGLKCCVSDNYDITIKNKLDEMIRIAKTPWLED